MEYIHRVSSIPGLSPVQHLECTLEAVLLCTRMAYNKTAMLFTYIAAMLAADMGNIHMATALVNRCLDLCGSGALDSKEEGCWYSVKATLLAHLISFYQEMQDTVQCARYAMLLFDYNHIL